jgi:hypothetical protein
MAQIAAPERKHNLDFSELINLTDKMDLISVFSVVLYEF